MRPSGANCFVCEGTPVKKRMLIIMALFSAAALIAAACGGGEPEPTATRAPTQTPTPVSGGQSTPSGQETTQAPTGGPVSLSISVQGDELKFTEGSFTVAAGSQVTLTLDNVSTTQQHNWALVEAGSKDDITNLGAAAGPDKGWIPDDPRILANTNLLDPGNSESITFEAPASGSYQFVCTFPGHNPTMFGDFVVQ